MKWRNIYAILLQEYYMVRGSLEIIFDIFLYTLASIVIFGFIASFLGGGSNGRTVQTLLITVTFWEALRINQYSTSVSTLWNMWAHNLSNMFIAPLKMSEYLTAHVISATAKSATMLVSAFVVSRWVFGINMLELGIGTILFAYLNMIIFATAIGLLLIGLVFQYGNRVQAITWGLIFLIQPLCAVFFPIKTLPAGLAIMSRLIPVSYIFEWLRAVYLHQSYSGRTIGFAFLANLLLLGICMYIFSLQVKAAKKSGQFVRNDL